MVGVNTVITRLIAVLTPVYIASYLVCKIQPNDVRQDVSHNNIAAMLH